jgi:hypothetical protein
MATEQEIKTLLDGRIIVDAYVLAKTDRSDREWTHPSTPELIKALEDLGFDGIDAFFLFDAKLSFLEITDKIEIRNRFTNELEPHCDNCIGREPQWCMEIMVAKGMSTACHQRKVVANIDTSLDYLNLGLVSKVLPSDPILDKQKAKAVIVSKTTGNLCTMNDIILFWHYHNEETNRCIGLVKMKAEFDFDPFWRLGEMCIPK